jgi:hypothetical protein
VFSWTLHQAFPYCCPYVSRTNLKGYKNLAILSHRASPESIKIYTDERGPTIISLFAAYDFGCPGVKWNRPQYTIPDTEQHRLMWLTDCLDVLSSL